jgi:streptogramin lyase
LRPRRLSTAWRFVGSKYGVAVGALTLALAVGTTAVSAATRVKPIATIRVGSQSGMVLSAAGSIWSSDLLLARVVRIDPLTNAVVRRIPFAARPFGIAYGAGSVWIADRSVNVLGRIDPRTNRVVEKITILDPARRAVVARINVGANPLGSAWIGGELWVPNIDDGTISVIDPQKNAVRTTLEVGHARLSIGTSGGDAWISNSNDGELWRVSASQPG